MLRYFYLLCLIVYIKECFCYDHISNQRSKFRPLGKRLKRKREPNGENCNEKNLHVIRRRQEYESANDNDQFAQIDVASFIQKPDFDADEELVSQQDDLNSQLMPKNSDYDILSNLYTDHSNFDGHKNLKSNHNPALFGDMVYPNEHSLEPSSLNSKTRDFQYNDFKSIFENEISADNLVHNPLKKSPMQHLNSLKFPFFFRKRNNASRATDNNYTTSKQQYTVDFSDLIGYSNDKLSQKDIKKRADNENNCLKCKNIRGNSKSEKRGLGKSIIHNSRQYYQKFKGDNKNKKVTKPQAENININKDTVKSEVPVKPSVDSHKQEEKKSYKNGHKKANVHKHNKKAVKKKKKLGLKEHIYSN